MSEEKKSHNNQDSHGHRPRHHYHKHKGPKNPQNAPEKKEELASQGGNTQKAIPHQSQGAAEKENKQKAVSNENKRRPHKHQKHDKNQNREKDRAPISDTPSILDESTENDSVFGMPFFSSRIKEKSSASIKHDDSDICQLSDEKLFGTDHLINKKTDITENSTEIVGVCFKTGGKVYYFDPSGIKATKGCFAIVDTARGLEFGEISVANRNIPDSNIVQPLRKVIRLATKEDIAHHESNKLREKDAFKICLEKIAFHKLDMKLVEAQYSFDNTKLLFYFTSAGRVDFRELVRDLASVFKTRIELRQIGIRDEAKMLGGIGMCGRPLCCSRHLSNFAQVSIKMAKEQGLSLNANKISGNCGRLMCCLNFENQVYVEGIKITPMPGSVVKVGNDKATVTDANPLTGMLKVHIEGAPDGEKVNVHRDSVSVVEKKTVENEENQTSEE